MMSRAELSRTGDEQVTVSTRHRDFVVTWTLAEQEAGSGDWRASGFGVTPADSSVRLTASDVRSLPIASSLRDAVALARKASASAAVKFGSPSDPPAVWREDGRGRGGARSERDYAELALAFVSAGDPKARRSLPRRWSERFGGAPKTWQNRLAEARNRLLLDGDDRLTAKAERLLFGNGLAIEARLIEAERRLAGEWKPGEREMYVANARRIEDVLADDQRLVDDFYS